MNSNSAAHISRVLASRQWTIRAFPACFRSTFHTSLCSTPVTALRCSYGGSDSRPPFTRAEGYPRFTSPESFCRSVSNHPMSSHVRFLFARFFSRSGVVALGPFPVRAHRLSRLRHWLAGSPRHQAESTFSRTDRQTRLPLLPTPPSGDAVTVSFQPVERLVESVLTSSSDVLSGALAPGFNRGVRGSPGLQARSSGRQNPRCIPPRRPHLPALSPAKAGSQFWGDHETPG
jgi:hypothetical protein